MSSAEIRKQMRETKNKQNDWIHRYRIGNELGKPLEDDETVHYVDGNEKNIRRDNILIVKKEDYAPFKKYYKDVVQENQALKNEIKYLKLEIRTLKHL